MWPLTRQLRADILNMILLNMGRVGDVQRLAARLIHQHNRFVLKHRKADMSGAADDLNTVTPAIAAKMPKASAGRHSAIGLCLMLPTGGNRIFCRLQTLLVQRLPLYLGDIPQQIHQ